MRMFAIAFPSTVGIIKLPVDFRPTAVFTSIESPGQSSISAIYIDNVSQLMTSVDAYFWSMKRRKELQDIFLSEHGLLGKSSEEIDHYCDLHEIYMPDPNRISLPAVRKDGTIRITGNFQTPFSISFRGLTP